MGLFFWSINELQIRHPYAEKINHGDLKPSLLALSYSYFASNLALLLSNLLILINIIVKLRPGLKIIIAKPSKMLRSKANIPWGQLILYEKQQKDQCCRGRRDIQFGIGKHGF